MLKIISLSFLLFCCPAWAIEVDLSTVITSLDGKVVPNCPTGKCDNPQPLTLGEAAVLALLNVPEEPGIGGKPAPVSAEEKFKNWQLAQKIYGQTKANLKAEEIAKIKEAIGKVYTTVVVGRSWTLLEGGSDAK